MATSTSSDSLSAEEAKPTVVTGSLLSFKNLNYAVKMKDDGGSKLLIDDISVDIRAGELLAVMVRPVFLEFSFFANRRLIQSI